MRKSPRSTPPLSTGQEPAGSKALLLIGHEHAQTHTYILCIETHLKNMKIHEVTHLIPTQEHEQTEENEGG